MAGRKRQSVMRMRERVATAADGRSRQQMKCLTTAPLAPRPKCCLLMRIQALTLSIALTLFTATHALPLPAKGTYSVCTGSVCTKYGADYVLEAAQALTVDGDISVRSAGCLNACKSREHKAVAIYCGQKAVVDACADDATLALDLTVKSLKEAGTEVARPE